MAESKFEFKSDSKTLFFPLHCTEVLIQPSKGAQPLKSDAQLCLCAFFYGEFISCIVQGDCHSFPCLYHVPSLEEAFELSIEEWETVEWDEEGQLGREEHM